MESKEPKEQATIYAEPLDPKLAIGQDWVLWEHSDVIQWAGDRVTMGSE